MRYGIFELWRAIITEGLDIEMMENSCNLRMSYLNKGERLALRDERLKSLRLL